MSKSPRSKIVLLAAGLAVAMVPALSLAAISLGTSVAASATRTSTRASTSVSARSVATARQTGTFDFASTLGPSPVGAPETPLHYPTNRTLRHVAASVTPKAPTTPVVSGQLSGVTGFNGLDAVKQATAGTGAYAGSQYDLEPPDQALCVNQSSKTVVESVNLAVAVYSTSGAVIEKPVALNQFFNVGPEISTSPSGTATYGPFLSDPKCYYDPATGGWFLSILELAVNPATGALTGPSAELVAATTGDPATTTWHLYSFDTTDDGSNGTPADGGCPCFGDQPLIGADAKGFYVSTNEFSTLGTPFNGTQIYALSKAALESAASSLAVYHYQPALESAITSSIGGEPYSVQPATSPVASDFSTSANGTEYFTSSLDFVNGASTVGAWSLTGTNNLAKNSTKAVAPVLSVAVVGSEAYSQPPNATQEKGPLVTNTSLPLVDSNDDRMNQVVYANGTLWSGLNTAVKTGEGSTTSGIAWFAISPSVSSGGSALSASMAGEGYVAPSKESVLYPSIGVTSSGSAIMAFTLIGPDYYPSAAYAPLSLAGGGSVGPIRIASSGVAPEDGFTSLKAYGGTGSDRWGDYSAAVATPDGSIWMATEYISGVERDAFANWSTYIWNVPGGA
ncbi:MAG: hypothetical protein JWO62_2762 [Acidimicrobiaceae bacterium]|nr:hypothetical protein [Acidimicrobiaceae bacterium]